jgi:hypothetical protein
MLFKRYALRYSSVQLGARGVNTSGESRFASRTAHTASPPATNRTRLAAIRHRHYSVR